MVSGVINFARSPGARPFPHHPVRKQDGLLACWIDEWVPGKRLPTAALSCCVGSCGVVWSTRIQPQMARPWKANHLTSVGAWSLEG